MRVLAIHQMLPVPPMDGGRLRRLQHLEAIGSEHDLTLIGRCPDREAGRLFRREHPAWRIIEVPEASEPGHSLVARTARELLSTQRFDCVHVTGLLQWPGGRALGRTRVVLDIENVDTMLFRRMRAAGEATVSDFELAATDALLGTACRRADLVLACSEPDAAALRLLAPETRIEIVPNGVDLQRFDSPGPPPRHTPRIVTFTGLLAYWPNADACEYFVGDILPRLERIVPAVTFQIVGRVPPANVVLLADGTRVRLAADVPDIRPWLAASDVLVVPLRAGSGTRLKILDGFAARRPVVSTSIGCEGLDVEDERHLLVADDPASFAGATARAITDAALADRLVEAGHALAQTRYDVPVICAAITALYREMARQ
jgi:polysaccharide biosynthesis protein PslH